ncbi:MAG TPA: PEP-CTERM sorting domain-containing protein [Lacipirellulaceae bacterium]|jgi:hypothetical protein|nr:PEP-CTERM sorting domain-containing protein [Lacipirellulaceae bacterium]
MKGYETRRWWWLGIALVALAQPAAGITIQIDYTYDSSNFFGAGNPQGAAAGVQAKAALQAAASYYSSILTDSFSAITVPAPLHSSVSNGVVTWSWQESFDNPATGATVTVDNPPVAANQYIIYAGAMNLSGSTLGIGAAGGFQWASNITGNNQFSNSDINTINATTASFSSAVETRGQSSGFSRWGGAISFDTVGTSWDFDYTSPPIAGQNDFYSVALHELAHSIGFGESGTGSTTAWESVVSGSNFVGSNAEALHGFTPIPLSADLAHWAQGTNSVVYGTNTSQETLMDPDITVGTRKKLTALDAAALKDIGWSLAAPPGLNGDYNNNGVVDAADYVVWRKNLGQSVTLPNDTTPGTVTQADYTVWRSNFGATSGSGSGSLLGSAVPEPISALLVAAAAGALAFVRRRS